jgi:hypothetical protein
MDVQLAAGSRRQAPCNVVGAFLQNSALSAVLQTVALGHFAPGRMQIESIAVALWIDL